MNLHGIAPAATSRQCVCQFRHIRILGRYFFTGAGCAGAGALCRVGAGAGVAGTGMDCTGAVFAGARRIWRNGLPDGLWAARLGHAALEGDDDFGGTLYDHLDVAFDHGHAQCRLGRFPLSVPA